MRILFLTDNFPPEVNAPASRTFEHCRAWVDAGHDVTVVTGFPNFPQGRVYQGYRNRCWQRERMCGVEVIRVWTYMTANRGIVRRTIDFLSFMATGAVAASCLRRPDVVVATSPQFFTACAGALVSAVHRRPFVFELRDLWPEEIQELGVLRSRLLLGALERIEMGLYHRASLVVAVTEGFRDRLIERGIDAGKIAVVRNGVDLSRFEPRAPDPALIRSLGQEGRFIIGYLGTHGQCQALEHVIEAAAICSGEPELQRCHFLLVGDGAEKHALETQASRLGLTNVTFLPPVSKDEVPRYWAILDLALIHVRRGPLFRRVIPSKLFECFGMGVPVVLAVEGESARIVNDVGAGVCVTPCDAHALVAAIRRLVDDPSLLNSMRRRAREAAPAFARDECAARMLSLLEGLGRSGRLHGSGAAEGTGREAVASRSGTVAHARGGLEASAPTCRAEPRQAEQESI
jgi:glycosyltransferase involved in cell wall biosynthesis